MTELISILPSPLFAWRGLTITVDRDTRTMWFEGRDGPLSRESAAVIECAFHNEPSDSSGYIMATGTREYLESTDALIKIVTTDHPLAFGG